MFCSLTTTAERSSNFSVSTALAWASTLPAIGGLWDVAGFG